MSRPASRLLPMVAAAFLSGAFAAAQTVPLPPPDRFEATVLAGYRLEGGISTKAAPHVRVLDLGDAATFGVAFDWRMDRYGDLEVQYSYTNSPATVTVASDGGALERAPSYDMGIHDVTFGLIASFVPADRPVRPYLGLGLGFTVLDPSNALPSTTKFTFSLAGGVRAYLSRRFGLRFEARWAPVYLFSTGPGGCDWYWFFCSSRDTGHVIQQADFRLGTIFRF